ncbi:hypothetical protein FOA52_013674 [Chlamydomonas sp. UWO 241]|nr:hypothetical protein FOA52_013674 [Chlamydomonas sp. UWO 241]
MGSQVESSRMSFTSTATLAKPGGGAARKLLATLSIGSMSTLTGGLSSGDGGKVSRSMSKAAAVANKAASMVLGKTKAAISMLADKMGSGEPPAPRVMISDVDGEQRVMFRNNKVSPSPVFYAVVHPKQAPGAAPDAGAAAAAAREKAERERGAWHNDPMAGLVLPPPGKGDPGTAWHHQRQAEAGLKPSQVAAADAKAATQQLAQQQQQQEQQQQQQGRYSSRSPPVSSRLRAAGAALPRLDTCTSTEFNLPPVLLHTRHSRDVGLAGEQRGEGCDQQWQGEGCSHEWEDQEGYEAGDTAVSGGFAAERRNFAVQGREGAGTGSGMGTYGHAAAAPDMPSPWSVDAGIWSAGGGGTMRAPQPFWAGTGSGRGLPSLPQLPTPSSSSDGNTATLASLWQRASDAVGCSATAAAAAASTAADAASAAVRADSPASSSGSWEAISAAAAHLLSVEPLSSPTPQHSGHGGCDPMSDCDAALAAAAPLAELQHLQALLLLSQEHGDCAAAGGGADARPGGNSDLMLMDGQLQQPLDGGQLAHLAELLAQLHGDAAASAAAAAAAEAAPVQYSEGKSSMQAEEAGDQSQQPAQPGVQSTRRGPQELPEAARQLLAALAGGVWRPTAPPTLPAQQQPQQQPRVEQRSFSGSDAVAGLTLGPPSTPPRLPGSRPAPPPAFLLPATSGTTVHVPPGATLIGPGGVPHTIGPNGRPVPMVAAQLPGGAIVMVPASALVHPVHHAALQLSGGPQLVLRAAGGLGMPAHFVPGHIADWHAAPEWQHGLPPTPAHGSSRRRGSKHKALTSSVVKVMHDGGMGAPMQM